MVILNLPKKVSSETQGVHKGLLIGTGIRCVLSLLGKVTTKSIGQDLAKYGDNWAQAGL